MKKVRPVVARNARELAKVLGLAPADGMEIEFRSDLNDKIIEVVAKKGLTHSDVARLAHTSRTRVTAILNRNTHAIVEKDLPSRVAVWGPINQALCVEFVELARLKLPMLAGRR